MNIFYIDRLETMKGLEQREVNIFYIDLSLLKPLHGLKTVVVKNVHVFGVMDILCFVSEFLCTHRQMPEMK